MQTLDDARRATELGDKRDHLIWLANGVRMSECIHFAGSRGGNESSPSAMLKVEVFTDEFQALMTRELEAQVAKIDAELRALGIEPEPIEEIVWEGMPETAHPY
jgi:hypothetical protein